MDARDLSQVTLAEAPEFLDIELLARTGISIAKTEKAVTEDQKLGTLRGGSPGIVLHEGDEEIVVGTCTRKALARSKGIDVDPAEEDRRLMFDAGFTNEDIWHEELRRSWEPEHGKILREEECMVRWTTKNGAVVSGRPDSVMCRHSDVPVRILQWDPESGESVERELPYRPVEVTEHKLCASIWTARDVLFEGKPKLVHLIQLGHYCVRLAEQIADRGGHEDSPSEDGDSCSSYSVQPLPGQLWYTNRVNMVGPSWGTNLFPRKGEPLSEHLEYGYNKLVPDGVYKSGKNKGKKKYRRKKIDIYKEDADLSMAELSRIYRIPVREIEAELKNVRPFRCGYLVRFTEDGVLQYAQKGAVLTWHDTIVTRDNIAEFYERVSTMEEQDELGPRPENLQADGGPGGYDPCTYCKARRSCEAHEEEHGTSNVAAWLDRVREVQDGQDN